MDNILKDGRFSKLINDPRYRQIPKTERKVKIDKRFQSMFDNDKFKVKFTIDKRGRPVNQSSSENLKRYYDLSSEDSDSSEDEDEDDEQKESEAEDKVDQEHDAGKFVRPPKLESSDGEDVEKDNAESKVENDELVQGEIPKKIKKKLRNLDTDYARGEGVLLSDSSSEEESEEEDKDDDLEHAWGELDADAETCEDATYRLAICNMDWDNIKALDLFILFSSFLPPGGVIKSVTIYPSEFGLKRMQEEEIRGPIELTEKKLEGDSGNESENEDGSKYHMERLRKYQLNRLKYYYAVVIFDSPATSNKIYTDCDGIEYESSATKLDLRFIPDDETFDQEAHDECLELPNTSKYKPRNFTTTALQQAKVQLTWDSSNPHRVETLKGAADGEVNDDDLKNYLACSSSDEGSDIDAKDELENETEDSKVDPIMKYKNLLNEIENAENKNKNGDVEMEITWGLGLKEKTKELVKKKLNKGEKLTPFEEMIEKKNEKKRAKKLERKKIKQQEKDEKSDENNASSDDVPSDIDMNDAYFKEEFDNDEFKNKNKKSKKQKQEFVNEDDDKKRAELELLLDDDDDGKAHFSLKKIQEAENETKSKKKRKFKKNKVVEDKAALTDFKIDVDDTRFSALFTSHHYNIDPTNPNFKKTKSMDVLIQEKLKRRPGEEVPVEESYKKPKRDPAMSVLVNNIKRKTNNFNKK